VLCCVVLCCVGMDWIVLCWVGLGVGGARSAGNKDEARFDVLRFVADTCFVVLLLAVPVARAIPPCLHFDSCRGAAQVSVALHPVSVISAPVVSSNPLFILSSSKHTDALLIIHCKLTVHLGD
jgi:hypothetical protein